MTLPSLVVEAAPGARLLCLPSLAEPQLLIVELAVLAVDLEIRVVEAELLLHLKPLLTKLELERKWL